MDKDPRLSILTPTIGGREHLLAQAQASVAEQFLPVEHLVLRDEQHEGAAATRNRLVQMCRTPFYAFLDDDDLLLAHHSETLLAGQEISGADVVWTWNDCEGISTWTNGNVYTLDPEKMEAMDNQVPITALCRRSVWADVGGFRDGPYEDWDFWMRVMRAGYRFEVVPTITWVYRFHGRNKSRPGANRLDESVWGNRDS